MNKIDWSKALETVDGDRELLRDVLIAVIDENRELLEQMKTGAAEGKPEELKIAAHTFKSSTRMLGSEEVGQTAEEIEQLGHDGVTDKAEDKIRRLEDQWQLVRDEIQQYLDEDHAE